MKNELFGRVFVFMLKASTSVFILFSACNSVASTSVVELTASEIPRFIAKHPHVVLQFTSTDPNCGYCIGADKAFDGIASKTFKKTVAFGRVTWPAPWRKIPNISPLIKVEGIPMQVIFINGQSIESFDGNHADIEKLEQSLQLLLADKTAQMTSESISERKSIAVAALTSNEKIKLRLHLRYEFFVKVAGYCAKQFPEQIVSNRKLLDDWKLTKQIELDEAAVLIVKRASQDADIDMTELVNLEKVHTKEWRVNKLGIPDNRAPLSSECTKMMLNLSSVD